METKKRNNLRSAGLWFYGLEFIETAADALAAYKKKNPTKPIGPGYAPFAIYFNFLHGIELCLKSYLVHEAGMCDEDLRSKEFRHNLDRLLDEAICHRLRGACTELTDTDLETIRYSSKNYSYKNFEYMWMGGSLEILPIDQVAKTAKVLRSGLENLVWAPMAQQWESLSDSEKKRAK